MPLNNPPPPGSILQVSPSLPAGTSSGSAVMMGMGSVCTVTPDGGNGPYARILLNFRGTMTDSIAGGIVIQARYGTGTPPANGAAGTAGTSIGAPIYGNVPVGGNNMAFNVGGIITGLTYGTAYWFDLSMLSGGGTVSLATISCDAMEMK
jgi:hypothetical protein